jgi:hypothetical protein
MPGAGSRTLNRPGPDALNPRRGLHGWIGLAVAWLFEMPVLGYLGFPPFALECYAMYHALRGVLATGTRASAAPLI